MVQIKDVAIIRTVAKGGDWLIMQDFETFETYRITKDNLLAGLTSGIVVPPVATNVTLTYVSDGDTNGVLYYLGSSGKTSTWQNPINKGVSITSSGGGSGSPTDLADRQPTAFYVTAATNNWVRIDLPKSLKCSYYSLRNRNYNGNNIRNWKLQGCNAGSEWVDLDTQSNNVSINGESQWLSLPVTNNQASFTSFRILQTGHESSGDDYLCLGEIELYGVLTL